MEPIFFSFQIVYVSKQAEDKECGRFRLTNNCYQPNLSVSIV